MAANTKRSFIVASEQGDWHYAPVEAESPEEAVRLSDEEAETAEGVSNGTEFFVYELVSVNPAIIRAKVQLAPI